MAECTELVGKGTIQYRCRLPDSHEGPHVAPENGPSQIARGRWEAEQRQGATPHQVIVDEVYSEGELAAIEAQRLSVGGGGSPTVYIPSTNDFRKFAMDFLNEEYSELPTPIRSWVLGAEAQMILRDLWRAMPDSGVLTIDRATLERVLPESLQG